MVTFRGVSSVMRPLTLIASSAALTLILSACNNGSFAGGNDKVEAPQKSEDKQKPATQDRKDSEKKESLGEEKESQNLPEKEQPQTQSTNEVSSGSTSDNVVIPTNDVDLQTTNTNTNTDLGGTVAETDPATTTPETNVNTGATTTPVTSDPETNNAVASLQVPVTCFVNMEHGYHGTDENYIVQLLDQSGSVIAAGYSTIDAVRNASPTDGRGAYSGLMLDFDMTWIKDSSIASGSGTLNVCYSDPNLPPEQGKCEAKKSAVGEDGERPTSIMNAPAQYNVTSQNGKPQIRVSGNFNLSTHHPVWGFAKAGSCFKDYQSPLVLDLNKNGAYDLVDVWNDKHPIRFDISADRKKVRTGWVKPQDGMLALDLNGNGKIDNGLELFGEFTKKVGAKAAAGDKSFVNGFQALAQYDTNLDGHINGKDQIFNKLLVWQDLNQDGVSQANELKSLAKLKIADISLAYSKLGNLNPEIVANNEVRLEASYKLTDGSVQKISDVWFKQRRYTDTLASGTPSK